MRNRPESSTRACESNQMTPEEVRRRDARALKEAMDAVANPTRVDASSTRARAMGDDDTGGDASSPSMAASASASATTTTVNETASSPTMDEMGAMTTVSSTPVPAPVVSTSTLMRPVPEGAIVVSSASELPNENGTKRPMVTVTDEEVANLEAYLRSGFGLVHEDGRDGDGRRVLVVNATRVPGWAGSADRDAALRLITKALTRAGAEGEYVVVVYFGDDDRTKGVVPSHTLGWLREMHDGLERETRKNVTKIIFVNASWFASTLISWSMTFASSKAREKFVWVSSLHAMEKESGFHVSAAMCGEAFLRSVGFAATPEASS